MRKADKRRISEGRNEFAAWMGVCRHFFPRLPEWLEGMADPRDFRYIKYEQSVLVMMCIMKGATGVVTMQGMNDAFNSEAAISNLGKLAERPGLDEMPDWQTANDYLERLAPEELEAIRRKMVGVLLRSKHFDRYKFNACWTLVLDGTGYAYFKERHCEHDLTETFTDPETGRRTTRYYHKLLEAKLVLAPGLVISIDTEFIENESADVDKQDCELRAAERMLARIKRNFPRLPLCVLGDGLYATMPFMRLCREYGWHYILNLKAGRQGTLYEEYDNLINAGCHEGSAEGICGRECGRGLFINGLDKSCGKSESCNVFEYRHKVVDDGETVEVRFVWVTDMRVTVRSLEAFVEEGRDRWCIENEGFNNQKNGIYRIDHLCSRHPNAMKAHYLITQITDMIMQLYVAFDKVLAAIKRPVKGVAMSIGVCFVCLTISEGEWELINKRTALRLNTG